MYNMDNKKMTIAELTPLYKYKSRLLIGFKDDYIQSNVNDGLVLEIDIEEKRIVNKPWSGQKKLKFGYYYPVQEEEKQELMITIQEAFDEFVIIEMIDLLFNPSEEAIESLIWLPERLKK